MIQRLTDITVDAYQHGPIIICRKEAISLKFLKHHKNSDQKTFYLELVLPILIKQFILFKNLNLLIDNKYSS